ncbi:flagella basal body P-ring formation protein FlgA [Paucibacter sp. KBW04]|uniref:flagella basal body P-ring formation protein FlgA n=1 Tax=Paucibacter sp. KBW04 TaxID=2153361 RepID=UPI0018CC2F7D|nr:flagella basal body P-ring formation protein FlgA [Paucibacter sp. KBW04]
MNGKVTAVAIPVQLNLSTMAWVSRKNFSSGQSVRSEDFDWAQFAWPPGAIVKSTSISAPVGRLRRPLRKAERLDDSNLVPINQRLQGDEVTVRWRSRGIELETLATLVADASVGERVRAQIKGSRSIFTGVLEDFSTVVLER